MQSLQAFARASSVAHGAGMRIEGARSKSSTKQSPQKRLPSMLTVAKDGAINDSVHVA